MHKDQSTIKNFTFNNDDIANMMRCDVFNRATLCYIAQSSVVGLMYLSVCQTVCV